MVVGAGCRSLSPMTSSSTLLPRQRSAAAEWASYCCSVAERHSLGRWPLAGPLRLLPAPPLACSVCGKACHAACAAVEWTLHAQQAWQSVPLAARRQARDMPKYVHCCVLLGSPLHCFQAALCLPYTCPARDNSSSRRAPPLLPTAPRLHRLGSVLPGLPPCPAPPPADFGSEDSGGEEEGGLAGEKPAPHVLRAADALAAGGIPEQSMGFDTVRAR